MRTYLIIKLTASGGQLVTIGLGAEVALRDGQGRAEGGRRDGLGELVEEADDGVGEVCEEVDLAVRHLILQHQLDLRGELLCVTDSYRTS